MKDNEEAEAHSCSAETSETDKTGDKKDEKKIQSPHDAVFQDFWSEKEVASSFIREYVPEEITKHLDFTTLKISKD